MPLIQADEDRCHRNFTTIAGLMDVIRIVRPSMRYGQIIVNALMSAGLTSDPYYTTDDVLIVALQKYLKEGA